MQNVSAGVPGGDRDGSPDARAGQVKPTVRASLAGDLEALVRLRLESGHLHVLLDPTVYRVPEPEPVRAHFAARLAADDLQSAMFVAVIEGVVLGLAEVVVDQEPPAHQILLSVPSAHVHLIFTEQARGRGVGEALEQAAHAWAADRGVRQLVAGIQSHNLPALRFYRSRG